MSTHHPFASIITRDAQMQKLFARADAAAQTDATILIHGETGTGKELLARAIHAAGPRRARRFVPIHCEAIPDTLLEGELFGWEKGAFTGAAQRRAGKFEWAHLGTVFLDEIGTLTAPTQVKLLRVLEDQQFERVGGNETLRVDVRVIAASNTDLAEEIREERFREDLYYRINVIPLRLPPLRERPGDIPLLAQKFVERFSAEHHRGIRRIAADAMRALLEHAWPGNVRELANTIERAVVLEEGAEIGRGSLDIAAAEPASAMGPWREYRETALTNATRAYLHELLTASQGCVRQAARTSGLSSRALYLMMKQVGIDPDVFRVRSAASVKPERQASQPVGAPPIA